MEGITDEELMQQVAEGDLDLLKILFERHHRHVFNFLNKMTGDGMLSEDLTQEVFYKIMKYRTTYAKGRFVVWMFTIARNSLKTYYKRNNGLHDSLDEQHEKLFKTTDEEPEDYTQLQRALDKLEAPDRELLILNRLREIKYNELAEIMNSTPGAVKTKVCRALKKLKTIYFENL
ncbi:RNA polymerase sigma-70 factor (ECF subfamily) [Gillisia sp. Hel_I_86]|uniref:RNA polymerase sigma factor n=1 Tax=Gillisia sp. Hel_I_86 TaxID=1249981 RepID=UPI0011990ED1|nr:sigma-70 family RNA polymerase sigma factor [Gillisia sp. Hel_I_86]TVZ25824.1 RNA polymerase sigma-70 factor (ECF subfamily) [Gillisia sp. Hel_I_86]